MIDLTQGAIAAMTSAVVSALMTFLLQAYLAKRIELRFARNLEQYKAEIALRMQTEYGIVTRRLEAYPKIVELCYRTRNMARDLTHGSGTSKALRDELLSRAKELEDYVFRFRIDLEADHVFVLVHRYKNLILEFERALPEGISGQPSDKVERYQNSFQPIEQSYQEVVHRLSEDGTYHQQRPTPTS